MIDEIYDPLKRYSSEFREKFADLAQIKFQSLLEQSKVDAEANRKLVKEIKHLETHRATLNGWSTLWGFLIFLAIIGIFCGGVLAYLESQNHEESTGFFWGMIALAVGSGCALFFWFIPKLKKVNEKIKKLSEWINKKKNEAWEQMRPLNDLFTWDIPAELIHKTYPGFTFDPFFTEERLQQMFDTYSWDNEFNRKKSVIYSFSGELNGNPFVLSETKRMKWGTKTYTGSKTITWTERVRDSDGKMRTVVRTEVLTASVEKPYPLFPRDKTLLYFHEAAPDLTFTRGPSKHSGSDGFFASIGKKMELKNLKKYAQNLDDDSDFTMMSNEEFELLFHATDRNHEVQFRVLFTALAQQQMVELMNDRQIGFGDDFCFIKAGMANLIQAENLKSLNIKASPERYRDYSVDECCRVFLSYNESFFKSFYFTFAPILSIPVYQQEQVNYGKEQSAGPHIPSFWECEAVANHYGNEKFAHPKCITQTVMEVEDSETLSDGSVKATIRASGFYGKDQVDYVSVYGGDGRWHNVAVPWVEYCHIDKDSQILVAAEADPEIPGDTERVNQMLHHWKDHYQDLIYFRKLFACRLD